GPDQVGTWTFMVLWWMHQSAKLNVFFGVRNLNEEFLPAHLEFLKSFLRKRSMNLLFPVSVTVSTVITVLLAKAALAPAATAFDRAGFTFLTVLMALAILEHWMLVLPMPAGALWQPGLRSRGAQKPFAAEIVVGFLGAGKTTFLQRMLKEADPAQRTVVLVNDFGALGLDGTLLTGQGADVVELANGCICCSLRNDLSAQLKDTVARLKPDRVLIEPSGVADVASLLRVLHAPDIAPLVASRKLYTVIDAGAFLRDYARMPDYFDVQTRLAPVFILNKTDLVAPAALRMVTETLRSLNPSATIVPARYGVAEAGALAGGSAAIKGTVADGATETPAPALGLTSWSTPLPAALDVARLDAWLAEVAAGRFGTVSRLKGLARCEAGWARFDIAGGHATLAAHLPRGEEAARVLVIGDGFDAESLAAALELCAAGALAPVRKLKLVASQAARLACGCEDHDSGFQCAAAIPAE
ncbi:MAG: DUF3623 family protein, partial [Caulobacteraceae bacterium]|nr:DUF3623 family protein [Caulobacter sp.]